MGSKGVLIPTRFKYLIVADPTLGISLKLWISRLVFIFDEQRTTCISRRAVIPI